MKQSFGIICVCLPSFSSSYMLLRTRRFTSSITTHHAAVTDLTSVRTVVTGTAIINNNNVVFETIRNARDISSATRGPIKNGKIYRMGCVSKASNGDVDKANDFGIKTWIDLRSPAELADDKFLHSRIYKDYEGLRYDKKQDTFVPFIAEETEIKESAKKRYFVSLMNESLIKRAIFFRLRKRTRAQVVCLFGLSFMSRRANKKMRSIFLDKINLGGLPLLSEIVMDYSAVEIVAVMKVLADSKSHPVALFCTAGKDRTGIIVMLCLHVLGATDEEIIADYILSDAAYKDINDKKAMVAGLKQRDVDPEIFLRAFPHVMQHGMNYLREKFGSINGFLDHYGFDETWRTKLRASMQVV